jgi:hypothetical protein
MEVGSSDTHLPSSPRLPVDVCGFAPGAIVADRYRLVALAGRGDRAGANRLAVVVAVAPALFGLYTWLGAGRCS